MPDLLSEDQTRAMFADLHAEEIAHVRAPGTQAAHRTVRRRRTTAAVTVAGCVAVALGGAFLLGQNVGRTSTPAPAPAARPSIEADNTVALGEAARQALGTAGSAPDMVSGSSGPLDTGIHNVDETGHFARYRLLVTCAGAGSIRVKFGAGPKAVEDDVTCGQSSQLSLDGPGTSPHDVTVTIEPDAAALHHAGFAYVIMHL
jgi:hypothetical protein